jgi:putative nucleotidyltransferase with HDIG domain
MDKAESEQFQNRFFEYTNGYLIADPVNREAYELKIDHSFRVRDNCSAIGISLNLNEEEIAIAETIGLFHDIGRFEQFHRYHTFLDAKSENHAELGAAVLRNSNILSHLEDDVQEVILKAVSYHNRLKFPEGESRRVSLFCKLIRDADKIDILGIVSAYYEGNRKSDFIELDLPDEPVYSEEILDDLFMNGLVDMNKMKTLNDFKLLQLGWIYDLNFSLAAKIIKEKHYLEKIRRALPESGQIDELLRRLNAHLDGLNKKCL